MGGMETELKQVEPTALPPSRDAIMDALSCSGCYQEGLQMRDCPEHGDGHAAYDAVRELVRRHEMQPAPDVLF